MSGKGTGSTSFEDMSHEQMLAWLDQANAGTVQAAATRLAAAAEEIRKIAEELKVRPQWVEWKGEGADAFRTWTGDLANATLRLGDFGQDSATWLGHASDAIAQAQVSIPRDKAGARANLDAATAAHNDPDAATVTHRSTTELAALAADKEKVRQEAAAQMTKLGQAYRLSATQLDGLERPRFPPPPAAIVPRDVGGRSSDLARPGGASSSSDEVGGGGVESGSAAAAEVTHRHTVALGQHQSRPSGSGMPSDHLGPSANAPETRVGIDSVVAPPEVHRPPTAGTGGAPATARPDTGVLPSASAVLPPVPIGPARTPSAAGGPGRPAEGGRVSPKPGQRAAGSVPGDGVTGDAPISGRNLPGSGAAPGHAVPGRGAASGSGVPSGAGVTGGRPVGPSTTGRPMGRLPGGTVVGGEPTASRGSKGGVPTAGPGGQPVGRSAGSAAGRPVSTPRDGVVGGSPQRTGRAPARTGPSAPSAPARGGISGGLPSEAATQGGVRGGLPRPAGGARRQREQKRRTERRSDLPVED